MVRPCSSRPKFFCKNVFHTKATPFMGRTIFGQVFVRGGMSNFQNPKVPPTGGRICRTHIQARLRCAGPRQLISPEIAAPVGRKLGVSDGVLDSIVLPSQTDASRGNESASSRADVVPGLAANHNGQPPLDLDCARKTYKLNSPCLAGKVYPHEIGVQKTRTNHRKLDS